MDEVELLDPFGFQLTYMPLFLYLLDQLADPYLNATVARAILGSLTKWIKILREASAIFS